MSRIQKCRTFTPLGDGSYLQKGLPGPASHSAWRASWNVFKVACLMLNICSLASMEAYSRQIEKLVTQWPRCWGLIYTADDAARAEKLGKLRRRLTIQSAQNRQVQLPPAMWNQGRRKSTGTNAKHERGALLQIEKNLRDIVPRRAVVQRERQPKRVKEREGLEICYSWASGRGSCADVPPGGECRGAVKRIHKCRLCLSPSHKDADCKSG